MIDRSRPGRIGFIVFGTPRYAPQGKGTERGVFSERLARETKSLGTRLESVGQVVSAGVIYTRSELQTAIDTMIREAVDCVIVMYLSWAEDFAWIRFLRDMPDVPTMFCCVRDDHYHFGNLSDKDNLLEFVKAARHVGTLQATASVPRVGRQRITMCAGNIETIVARVAVFARAAKTRTVLRNAVFGLLPNYHEVMWSTYVSPYDFFTKAGPELRFISAQQLALQTKEIPDSEVEPTADRLANTCPMDEQVDRRTMVESIRASIAVDRLAERMELDALAINDIDAELVDTLGLRPGFCPITSGPDSLIVTPEADVSAALAVYILKVLTGDTVNFCELFYPDTEAGTIVIGHAGPNEYHFAEQTDSIRIAVDERFADSGIRFAGAPWAWVRFSPGKKTMVNITESDCHYRATCAVVESVDGPLFLRNYSHTVIRPPLPPDEFFMECMSSGVTQHWGLANGDLTAEVEQLSAMMGFEYRRIG